MGSEDQRSVIVSVAGAGGTTTDTRIAAELGIQKVLEHLGIANELGTEDTPRRVVKALMEFMKPFDPKALLTQFEHTGGDKNGFSGMVVQSGIPFRMLCEHHLMPATGQATLGYIPDGHVVGLSKLARLVDAVGTERPSLQEHICDRITDLMEEHVAPKGTMCVVTAEHGCMACRGVNRPGVATTTSSIRGVFVHVPQARQEFFELAKQTAR